MAGEVGVAGLASLILNRGGFKIKPYASRASKLGIVVLLYPSSAFGGWGVVKQQSPFCFQQKRLFVCRGGRIRTYDLLVPNQARYRATLHPEHLTGIAGAFQLLRDCKDRIFGICGKYILK